MKYVELKAGDKLVADGGFTCITEGAVLTVSESKLGEFSVPCSCGGHFLGGQIDGNGDLVGLSKV